MNTLLKKILIILVVILILALVAFLVYNFFMKAPPDEPADGELPEGGEGDGVPEGDDEDGDIIPSPTLKIKSISTERVLGPTLSSDGTKIIYYSQHNGNVWQSSFDGSNLTRVSSTELDDLKKIIWSPDKTKVISIYQDEEENIDIYVYDYTTGRASAFSSNIKEIAWSSASSKIAYQYTDDNANQNNISIADPDGTNWQVILDTRLKHLNIDWTASDIAFYEKPSGITQSSLFLLNPLSKELVKVLSNIYGLSVKWSPQGDKMLYSQTNNQGENINLYLALRNGSNETSAGIVTFVEKCVWAKDGRTIFCAIPKEIKLAGVLPDNFYKGLFTSDDEFWKINLDTGEKMILLEPWEREEEIYDAVDLFLSPLEDYLFFINKKDGLLYSIEL